MNKQIKWGLLTFSVLLLSGCTTINNGPSSENTSSTSSSHSSLQKENNTEEIKETKETKREVEKKETEETKEVKENKSKTEEIEETIETTETEKKEGEKMTTESEKENLQHQDTLKDYQEYDTLNTKIPLSDFTSHIQTDNPGKRVILFKNENGQVVYKSIFVKKKSYLKIIDTKNDNGLVFNGRI